MARSDPDDCRPNHRRVQESLNSAAPCQFAGCDLESADRVIALKEAEHRFFLETRFPGWENRTSYWHVDDIDVAEPAYTIAAIDQLVRELIKDCRNDLGPNSERCREDQKKFQEICHDESLSE